MTPLVKKTHLSYHVTQKKTEKYALEILRWVYIIPINWGIFFHFIVFFNIFNFIAKGTEIPKYQHQY